MHDTQNQSPVHVADIAVAFSLLSRLPVPLSSQTAAARSAHAVWAYPLVGAVLALIAASIGLALARLGIAGGAVAAITLLVLALLTGGLHEDGLSDTADGLFGGRDKTHILEIMRDSRLGAYGVLALALFLLIRWSALSDLLTSGTFIASLVFAATASRAFMGLGMHLMPAAREDGLAALTGSPPLISTLFGLIIAIITGLMLFGLPSLMLLLGGLAAASLLWRLAQRKINGQTGDILGATQLISETAILTLATALLV